MPRFTPTSGTTPDALGSASCMAPTKSRATTWSRPWTRSAWTVRCWSRRSACIATTRAMHSKSWHGHPGRFGLIKPFDPSADDVAEQVEDWAARAGTVGARIMLRDPFSVDADDPGLNRILAAGGKAGIPVNVLCWGNAPLLGGLAKRNPDTRIVLDHLGLRQARSNPRHRTTRSEISRRWSPWPSTTMSPSRSPAPARCPTSRFRSPTSGNRSSASSMRSASSGVFGVRDWTRAVNLLTYAEGVDAFRVTDVLSGVGPRRADGRQRGAHLRLAPGTVGTRAWPRRTGPNADVDVRVNADSATN